MEVVRVSPGAWKIAQDHGKNLLEKKSYSKTRQVFRSNQDSVGAVGEMYYAKWLQDQLIPAKWNGLGYHFGGDKGDIELDFDGWIDIKTRELHRPLDETFEFIIDDKSRKDTIGYYMFAAWHEPTMEITLAGWLKADEIDRVPTSRRVEKGQPIWNRSNVIAHNDMTLIRIGALRDLSTFYYPKNVVDNFIDV